MTTANHPEHDDSLDRLVNHVLRSAPELPPPDQRACEILRGLLDDPPPWRVTFKSITTHVGCSRTWLYRQAAVRALWAEFRR
ncbi:MAG: hypothetical protein WD316_08555 [Phycisphaeraceae bacterium]